MSENTWVLNDSAPVPFSQEFVAPAAAWIEHDWLAALGYGMASEAGGTIIETDGSSAGIGSGLAGGAAVFVSSDTSGGAGSASAVAAAVAVTVDTSVGSAVSSVVGGSIASSPVESTGVSNVSGVSGGGGGGGGMWMTLDGKVLVKDGKIAINPECCCDCCCPIFSHPSLATGKFIARVIAPSCPAADGVTVTSRSTSQPCEVISFDQLCWQCDNGAQFASLGIAILCDFPDNGCFGIGMQISQGGPDCPVTIMLLSPASTQYPTSCSCTSGPGNKFFALYGPYSLTGIGGDPNNCCTEFYIRVEEV